MPPQEHSRRYSFLNQQQRCKCSLTVQDVMSLSVSDDRFCVSAETEAEGPGAGRQHQTELEEAGRWKSLPQGRQEDQQEEEEEGGAVMLSCCVCFHQRKVWFFASRNTKNIHSF